MLTDESVGTGLAPVPRLASETKWEISNMLEIAILFGTIGTIILK